MVRVATGGLALGDPAGKIAIVYGEFTSLMEEVYEADESTTMTFGKKIKEELSNAYSCVEHLIEDWKKGETYSSTEKHLATREAKKVIRGIISQKKIVERIMQKVHIHSRKDEKKVSLHGFKLGAGRHGSVYEKGRVCTQYGKGGGVWSKTEYIPKKHKQKQKTA